MKALRQSLLCLSGHVRASPFAASPLLSTNPVAIHSHSVHDHNPNRSPSHIKEIYTKVAPRTTCEITDFQETTDSVATELKRLGETISTCVTIATHAPAGAVAALKESAERALRVTSEPAVPPPGFHVEISCRKEGCAAFKKPTLVGGLGIEACRRWRAGCPVCHERPDTLRVSLNRCWFQASAVTRALAGYETGWVRVTGCRYFRGVAEIALVPAGQRLKCFHIETRALTDAAPLPDDAPPA
jgi:hypothetical protein